jgi:hypothetical protein
MIKYIPLDQDVLNAGLNEIEGAKCLLLFPTRRSKLTALKRYQKNWDFSDNVFLTMDEWKESLFASQKPLLREEKRTLALYQSLKESDKDFFKIHSYHQFIETARNFFDFWEEMLEEQIEFSEIYDILANKQSAENWQLQTFQKLQQMRRNYADFLMKTGFSDKIFLPEPNKPDEWHFTKIIVVNQFYFTKLEKRILNSFPNQIVILIQIPENCFRETELQITNFTAKDIAPFIRKKVHVSTSPDPTAMIIAMAKRLTPTAEIIDFRFSQQPYAHLLSGRYFSKSDQIAILGTRFYRFWKLVYQLHKSIVKDENSYLVSIHPLYNLSSADEVFACFGLQNAEREKFRNWLCDLIDNDFHYLDLDFVRARKSDFLPAFEQIFYLLSEINRIECLGDLLKLIESKTYLPYLLSDMNTRSDLAEVLFSAFSDFVSIEKIGLVKNWQKIFPINLSSNLIKLFLDYLKPKKLKLNRTANQTRFNLTSLQDTRNLQYENLFILNVVEGMLPDSKHAQFLFTENQRRQLGLKTYEDITLRDKYYFFRLLCNTQNVYIFTRQNVAENIEISSFLEELKLQGLTQELPPVDHTQNSKNLFEKILLQNDPLISKRIESDFFAFKYDRQEFKDNSISLSFYNWDKLQRNPFQFYLEVLVGLKERNRELNPDFSSKLIGIITHEIITLVFKRLIDVYQSSSFQHNFTYNTKLYVRQAIENYMRYNRDLKYYSPHNFSDRYFQHIFLPILAKGIENFFFYLHNDLKLSDSHITILPETSRILEREFLHLINMVISLKGRPDLRIHAKEKKFIFDFKTGSVKTDKLPQLQFYEEICYLIDSPEMKDEIESYLYFVEQSDLKKLVKRSDLKADLNDIWRKISLLGFMVPKKKDLYETVEITRRDLWKDFVY